MQQLQTIIYMSELWEPQRSSSPTPHCTELTEAQRRAGRATPKNNLTYTLHVTQTCIISIFLKAKQ